MLRVASFQSMFWDPATLTADTLPFLQMAYDTLITSAGLVDPLLAADREALGSGDVYDTAYFDRFFAKAGPLVERRISHAIAATAAVITHAWEEAGKPSMADVPMPERRRRPTAQ